MSGLAVRRATFGNLDPDLDLNPDFKPLSVLSEATRRQIKITIMIAAGVTTVRVRPREPSLPPLRGGLFLRAMSSASARQPWPMKWVLLVILAVIVPYTYVRWHYRKPGRAFEPYHDIKDRANTMRLLSAGFQRVTLEADRLADPMTGLPKGESFPAPGGLPEALAASLVDTPLLPVEVVSVAAAANAAAMISYPIQFTCTLANNSQQFSGAYLYVRSEEIFIVPTLEKLSGGLQSRTREMLVRVTVPAGTLKPGHYRVTLVGARMSRAWTLEVQ